MDDAKDALPYFEQACQLLTAINDRRQRAATELNIGAAYRLLGDKQKARIRLVEASAQLTAIGDRFEQSRAMYLRRCWRATIAIGTTPDSIWKKRCASTSRSARQ